MTALVLIVLFFTSLYIYSLQQEIEDLENKLKHLDQRSRNTKKETILKG